MAEDKRTGLLEEAVKDAAFVEALKNAETPEEAQKVFASKGIDYSIEEVKAIAAGIQGDDGELSEENLEAVAGGSVLATIAGVVKIVDGIVGTISIVKKWKW